MGRAAAGGAAAYSLRDLASVARSFAQLGFQPVPSWADGVTEAAAVLATDPAAA